MENTGTNNNWNRVTENLDFSNLFSINPNESQLAFETAIGDMEHESSIEWTDEFLGHILD